MLTMRSASVRTETPSRWLWPSKTDPFVNSIPMAVFYPPAGITYRDPSTSHVERPSVAGRRQSDVRREVLAEGCPRAESAGGGDLVDAEAGGLQLLLGELHPLQGDPLPDGVPG